jgi:hypothetical protein
VTESLLRVHTTDAWTLDGWLQPGQHALAIFIHGTGSNFYSSALFDSLSGSFLEKGIGVLRVNTRGHDLVFTQQGKRGGAAYEVVDACRHDLRAWCAAAQQIHPHLILVGHSLGAVKALYAQAHDPHPAVRSIVAISPPRLSHSWFVDQAPEFRDAFRLAREQLDAGHTEQLLDVTFPLPFLSTPAGYVEKYGPEERYNILRFLSQLHAPTLVTLGGKEMSGNVAFRGLDEAIRSSCPDITVEVLPAADHVYSACRAPLAETIVGWLASQQANPFGSMSWKS